jgi:Glyoxalase-like domain
VLTGLEEAELAPEADRQLPVGDEIFLDHVGHFVRDQEAAGRALARAGFAPTPVSIQYNLDGTPMGTGNITAMLTRGYIEVLFKAADTPLGREFEATLAGHSGVHLANFVVDAAARHHQRLTDEGFAMRPLVQFQRPVSTDTGEGVAAFTVVRLERGAMAEGRIQILTHRTEDTVWQKRWLAHPNGALALIDLVIASPDVAEATARFERFLGRQAKSAQFGQTTFVLDRGQLQLLSEAAFTGMFPEIPVPRLPFIGAYAIRVRSFADLENLLKHASLMFRRIRSALIVRFPEELGVGAWVFVENAADLPWRS